MTKPPININDVSSERYERELNAFREYLILLVARAGSTGAVFTYADNSEAAELGIPSAPIYQGKLFTELIDRGEVKISDPHKRDAALYEGLSNYLEVPPFQFKIIKLNDIKTAQNEQAGSFSFNQTEGTLFYENHPIIKTHSKYGDKAGGRRRILIRLWDNRAIESNGISLRQGTPQTREGLRMISGYKTKDSVDAAIKDFNRQIIKSSAPAKIQSAGGKGQILYLYT